MKSPRGRVTPQALLLVSERGKQELLWNIWLEDAAGSRPPLYTGQRFSPTPRALLRTSYPGGGKSWEHQLTLLRRL